MKAKPPKQNVFKSCNMNSNFKILDNHLYNQNYLSSENKPIMKLTFTIIFKCIESIVNYQQLIRKY